jgi:hypothetical protein
MTSESVPQGKRSRQISSIGFPYVDLNQAVIVARTIHGNSGSQCSVDQLAAWLKHENVESGAFQLKIAGARTFGLIETNRDQVVLTTLGLEIVETDREKAARVQAFLTVPLYKRAYEHFRGRQLPPAIALERELATFGVAQKQTDKARQVLMRSADQAGFLNAGRDRLVLPSVFAGSNTSGGSDVREESAPTRASTTAELYAVTAEFHPLISGLVQTIPSVSKTWPREKREQWLATAKNVFDLLFGSAEES